MPAWVGVRVPFPFGGAAARVVFYERANPDNYVSSYLDVNDELGCMDCKPYFEIYPDESGDTFRFWATEQEKMYPVIVKALAERRRANRRAKPLPPSMGTESGGR